MADQLFLNFSMGITLLVAGFIQKKFPPKWPNLIYGYRTPVSLKNKDTFDFANKYSARLMTIFGFISLIIGIFLTLFFNGVNLTQAVILITEAISSCVLLFIFTEKKLRKTFDKSGNKKANN